MLGRTSRWGERREGDDGNVWAELLDQRGVKVSGRGGSEDYQSGVKGGVRGGKEIDEGWRG